MIFADAKSDSPVTLQLAEPGEDRELKAIAYCTSVLLTFRPEERRRIVTYLCQRFPEEVLVEQNAQTPKEPS